jgi:hypothetical protein
MGHFPPTIPWVISSDDVEILHRLRRRFLDSSPGTPDYWTGERDLSVYDTTYARRIAWKWSWVLRDLIALGWTPPSGPLVDWACGTGVAARTVLSQFPEYEPCTVHPIDRSRRAVEFATSRIEALGTDVVRSGAAPDDIGLLVVSHVIDELNEAAVEHVLALARRATSVIWVEPGDRVSSRALVGVRERLRPDLNIIAPCTHQAPCGMTDDGWCHQFASSPLEAFTDPGWSRFAAVTGIDLRSLPVSFLVLDRRPAPERRPHQVRLIGRPEITKPEAIVTACDEAGVSRRRITKRGLPDAYRQARKGRLASRLRMDSEDGVVVRVDPDQKSTVNGA